MEIAGIINFSSRDWLGKTNFNQEYTGGRCKDDCRIIRKNNGGKLPSVCLLIKGGKVVTRAGRVVASFRYNVAEHGNSVWLREPDEVGEYLPAPQITEEEIRNLLSPYYGDGNRNPCPSCGRYMEYGACRWTDCD